MGGSFKVHPRGQMVTGSSDPHGTDERVTSVEEGQIVVAPSPPDFQAPFEGRLQCQMGHVTTIHGSDGRRVI